MTASDNLFTSNDPAARWEATQRAALAKYQLTGEAFDLQPGLDFKGCDEAKGDPSVGESSNWYYESVELDEDGALPEIIAAWNSLGDDERKAIEDTELDRLSEALNEDKRNDDPRI